MKQVLKRFVTLALIVALVAAIFPAVMPTASAVETPLESATEGFLGLAVSYDGGSWKANTHQGYTGGTMTVAAEGCGGTTLYTPVPSTLTLKNDTSQPATLAFDYIVELNSGTITIDGANVTGNGSFEKHMSPWESIEINVLSCDFAEYRTGIQMSNMSFTVEENITVTFAEPSNGAYSLSFTDAEDVPHSFNVEQDYTTTVPFGTTFTVSATPYQGQTFLGWFNDTDFACLSSDATAELLVTCTCTVYPYFYNAGTLQFKVGDTTHTDLNAADAYATAHNNEPIILLGDGTLPAGNWSISKDNTLLIPCDDEFTLCTTDPEAIAQVPSFSNTHPYRDRSLKLAPGATLNVSGDLCVAGKQNMSMPCIGATSGDYGYIQLSSGSNITVNNGGNLYCWGYITGEGTVTAKRGATVYEPFQVMDFRGGTATMQMMNTSSVFPISQYYVQNIESRLTLEYGARELVRSVTNAGGMVTPATVPFIDRTGANALFQMDNGCTFTKYYDAENDRVCFEVDGNCSINAISLTVVGGGQNGDQGLTVNSADYMLPLNGNFDVTVKEGSKLTVSQDMYVQPGASITIDDGAELYVPCVPDPDNPGQTKPVSVIIYDSEDWGGYCGTNNQAICPIRYTPSGPDNIRDVPSNDDITTAIPDATVNVNGQITLDGNLYTTEHGANVTSTGGTGKIMFNNDAPERTTAEQATQSGTEPSTEALVITSVQLHYGDEYISTEGVTADPNDPTPFNCGSNGWVDAPDYVVTYNVLGEPMGAETVNSVIGTMLPNENSNYVTNRPQSYTFVGWSLTELEGNHNAADLLPMDAVYQPAGNVTLYAVFRHRENDFVKVTSIESEEEGVLNGYYLIVDEAGPCAFNASGTTSEQITGKTNYLTTFEINNDKIVHNSTLENATVEIRPAEETGHYYIKNHGGTVYLGCTGGGSASFNVNDRNEYTNAITISNGVATIMSDPWGTNSKSYPFMHNTSASSDKFSYFAPSNMGKPAYHMPTLYRMGTNYYTTSLGCLHSSYTSVPTAATCTEGGYTTCTCSDPTCGYIWIDEESRTDPLGHDYTFVITEPTEDEQGYTTYTCSRCLVSYVGDYTDPLGHEYTVNFVANGESVGNGTYNSLHGSGLPATAPDVVGYNFVGWSESQLDTEVATATVLSGYYTPPHDNMTLYAVYARSSAMQEENNGDYIKVANGDQIRNGGKYLLVCEETNKAFNGAAARVDENNDVDVTIVTENVERSTIAATAALDAGAVTVNYAFGTGAYYITIPDGRKIGNTGSGSGINANAHKDYANRISVDANGYARVASVESNLIYSIRYYGKFNFYSTNYKPAKSISLYYKDGTGDQLFFTTSPLPCDHRDAEYVLTPATCTEDGYYTYTCPHCNMTWKEDEAVALGHNYVITATVAPSAENSWIGYTTRTCTRCGDTFDSDYTGVDFTVTYSDCGTLSEPVPVNSYYGVQLPATASEIFGYEFVGWSEVTVDPEHEIAETHKGKYQPTANVTLYATYARYVDSVMDQERDYVRIDRNSNFASGGKVLIVCEDHEGGPIAFNGNADPVFSTGNFIYVTINETENGIRYISPTNTLSAAEIAVKPIAGTHFFTMQIPSGKYIGNTGSSTGINQNNNPNYKTSLYIDEYEHAIIENVGGKSTYHFLYNVGVSSNRFGFYNPGGANAVNVALYYKEGTEFKMYYTTSPTVHVHTYDLVDEIPASCATAGEQTWQCLCGDYYTVTIPALGHDYEVSYEEAGCTTPGSAVYTCSRCGNSYTEVIPATGHIDEDGDGECDVCFEPMETEAAPEFVSANLVLNGKIDVAYTVKVPEGYSNPRVVFTGPSGTESVTAYTRSGENYVFTYTGVNPQCMGDNISATLYATKNGAEESVSHSTYSVRDYCVNQLRRNDLSASLRTLLSDMLAYGAAAQTYTGYKANELVTTGATGTTCSTFTNLSGLGASFDGEADANTYWVSAGLTLTDSVAMTFRFRTDSVEDLTVEIRINGRPQTFTSFTAVGNGIYEVSFTGISADEFGSSVTASFECDGEQVGNTVSYSVNAYVCAKQNDSNANLATLVKALYNYGVSAAAYAG